MPILPFLTCTAAAVSALASIRLNLTDTVATLLALGIGTLICLWLTTKMTVEGSANGRFYTRCGWPYLVIWLGVVGVRASFQGLIDEVLTVTNAYHGFESAVDLSSNQLFNFFLFLVFMMIMVRTIRIWVRKAQINRIETELTHDRTRKFRRQVL